MAALYAEELKGVEQIRLANFGGDDYYETFQNYVIRAPQRDRLRAFLKDRGVETLVSWPKPMWEHPALQLGHHSLPETESICREVISLPLNSETTREDVEITSSAIRDFFASKAVEQKEHADAVSA
jgi:dTDP-4-amino-4,6-dideoxygalactose transaminase